MKIFFLQRLKSDAPGYDETHSCVVRAHTPGLVRKLAGGAAKGDEGAAPWLDPKRSRIECLGPVYGMKPAAVICVDYHTG